MAKAQQEKGTKEYVLKRGHEFNGFDADGARHTFIGGEKDNDRVYLTDVQAVQLKDKFESVADMEERMKLQKEAMKAQQDLEKTRAALAEQGVNLDDLLAGKQVTIKKPEPTPSVGTQEPTPENVTPPPVGSTPDPSKPVVQSTDNKSASTSTSTATAKKDEEIAPPKTK